MTLVWDNQSKEHFRFLAEGHFSKLRELKNDYGLNPMEMLAMIYFAQRNSETRTACQELNSALSHRDMYRIEKWKPFLYYLLQAMYKIPSTRNCTVFTLQDNRTERRYQIYNKILWTAFTRTTINTTPSSLSNIQGTWISIDIIEGKDISIFSEEKEIILLPNSQFYIEEIMTPEAKRSMAKNFTQSTFGLDGLEIIHLKQITPTISLWQ